MNDARFDHSCKGTVIRNKIKVIAVGGWNKDGVLNSTDIMDAQTRTIGSLHRVETRAVEVHFERS